MVLFPGISVYNKDVSVFFVGVFALSYCIGEPDDYFSFE